MTEETLLLRARSNLNAAAVNFQFAEEDDFYVNLAGYLLQQATELFLKHHLEINGIRYPKTHDISTLIDMSKSNQVPIIIPERIELFAGTLTSWESKTRYIKNYFLAKTETKKGFEIVNELFDLNDTKNMNSF